MNAGPGRLQVFSPELLTLSYLLLPHLQFCFGWLQPMLAWPIALIISGGAVQMFLGTRKFAPLSTILSPKLLAWIVFLSLLLTMSSGIGGLSYQREDYVKHNLLYHDLIQEDWPVEGEDCNGQSYFLSYYLAYYLPSAGLASLIQTDWIEGFSFLWGWLGIGVTLLWVRRLLPARPIWAMGLFLCFGGLDVVENILREWDVIWFDTPLPYPMAWTVDCQLPEQWGLGHNYPGHMSQLGWAPQHAISGWLASAWCLHEILDRKQVAHVGFILMLTLFWSPFIFLGLFALVGIAVLKAGIRPALSWHNILPPLLWVGLMAAYYGAHPPLAYNGFVWEYASKPGWGWSLCYFGLGEFGLYAVLLYLIDREFGFLGRDRDWIWIVTGLLLVILFYRIGRYNDVSLRVSGPPVFWMFILIGRAVFSIKKDALLRLILLFFLLIASMVPLQEILKNSLYPLAQWKPELIEMIPQSLPGHMFVRHTLLRRGARYSDLTPQSSIRDIEAPCQKGVPLANDALFWQYVGKKGCMGL